MRVVPCLLMLVGLCLSAGCNLFNKRPANPADRPAETGVGGGAGSTARPPAFGGGDAIQPAGGEIPANGMVAGQILDNLTGQPPPDASIRVTSTGDDKGKPIEVTANAQGYFTIENLKRGQQYKLEARARQGDKLLAGTTYTSAPNIRVLVKISEDFVTPGTPDVPGAPVPPGKKRSAKEKDSRGDKKEQPTSQPSAQWNTPNEGSLGPGGSASVGIGPPRGLKEGAPAPQPWQHQTVPTPQSPPDSTKIAGTEFASNPPVASWQPNGAESKPARSGSPALPDSSPARVPSCVLVGSQLYNFALYDPQGQPWEFRKQRRGKVVLLDFWFTSCPPCIATIPHLQILKSKYGPYGLEIIGIANERAGLSFQAQAERVNAFARLRNIDYQLLMSGGSDCPVVRQFNVTHFPTLVLLDESGRIQRRFVGEPSQRSLEELEWEIQKLLKIR